MEGKVCGRARQLAQGFAGDRNAPRCIPEILAATGDPCFAKMKFGVSPYFKAVKLPDEEEPKDDLSLFREANISLTPPSKSKRRIRLLDSRWEEVRL